MPQTTSQWTCPRCGSAWVNVVTFEPVKDRAQETKVRSIACPKCGGSQTLMGKPGEAITDVRTIPKTP